MPRAACDILLVVLQRFHQLSHERRYFLNESTDHCIEDVFVMIHRNEGRL